MPIILRNSTGVWGTLGALVEVFVIAIIARFGWEAGGWLIQKFF